MYRLATNGQTKLTNESGEQLSDYRLDRLNTREFEHLSQALCKKFVATGVTPFGDGPDGGREATFDGKMDFPSASAPWAGYLVVQCKFRQRSNGDTASDTEWVTKELSSELAKYGAPKAKRSTKAPKRGRRSPDYYIFITNAVLSGNAETGGHDKCDAILRRHMARLGMQGYAIWGFDELRSFLDLAPEIRQSYIGFILPDDVLHRALIQLSIDTPDFARVLENYLQKELQSDYAAKLESAGQHDEKRVVPLSKVFIDLPFTPTKEASLRSSESHDTLACNLITAANAIIRHPEESKNRPSSLGRFAIVGGPGQGKSTIGQYLCQLYRAALLEKCKTLDPQCAQIIDSIVEFSKENPRFAPESLRFPFRIILNRFASDLAKDGNLTVVEYIRQRVEKLGSAGTISTPILKQWISGYPWIFVLDGLDEVPSSSNRTQVLEAIQHFLIDLSTAKADAVVIATTRPQGYADEFASSHFQHIYLPPLSAAQALKYGSSLLEFRANGDMDKFETTRRRLAAAASNEATMRLMSSPLQVTIMATLVERLGEPPKQRYRLFEEYYRTIYTRETNREGAHSELLRDRKTDVDTIHYRTGLLLQAESELAGKTAALLTLPRFLALVRQRLSEQGLDGTDSDRLINEIKTSALDRLIFLVSPHDEEIGFEIRSLQEFMAAEAIARGTTEHVRLRIEEVAPITNWRNVFLFLVGKLCDADSVELLDHIIILCDDLNDSELNPDYSSIRWGSRLAIDILSDGAMRPAPKRERRLLSTALEILDQCFFTDAQELASIYHERLEDMYRDKLESIMVGFDCSRALPAWELLDALATKQVKWARDLHGKYWKKLSDYEKFMVAPSEISLYNEWHLQTIAAIFPQLSPGQAFPMIEEYDQRNKALETDWPKWLVALYDLHDNFFSFNSDSTATSISVKIRFGNTEIKGVIGQVLVEPMKINLDILEMPNPSASWEGFLAAIKFATTPNKHSLGSAIRAIGRAGVSNAIPWLRSIVPWPLSGLFDGLHSCGDDAELITLAEELAFKADAGKFGDFDDWVKAESLSQQTPITYNLADKPGQLPYDRQSLKRGLPLAGSYSLQSGDDTFDTDFDFWLRTLAANYETPNGAWLARCAHTFLFRLSRSKAEHESMHDSPTNKLAPDVISTYFVALRAQFKFLDPQLVHFLLTELSSADSIPELLDALVSGKGVTPNHAGREMLSTLIREATVADRLSERSLRWAIWATATGLHMGLSKMQLDMSPAADALDPVQLAMLRLGASDLTEEECRSLIGQFSANANADMSRENVRELGRAIEQLPPESAKPLRKLALESFAKNVPLAEGWPLSSSYGYTLYEALDERKSSLRTSLEKWASLGFLSVPTE
ncbi:NACHT domain-containing protein [Paraburkholderia phenazinium]|uniref:NACHT domain-containing protein n=1 Tax=Paraburkholderia phenazinium TaxID=60549 RepID=A0A1N6HJC3_9BURK|nr:hypothetical protein [Paraburkholderia phenazinium]SIO19860.1 hypothetical protein SAMN05444168_3343 [Paraburkholderia phenazinium]